MHEALIHGSWGAVHQGCPIGYCVPDDGETVDFVFGRDGNYFELSFDAAGLLEFVRLGVRALQEMDALPVEGLGSMMHDDVTVDACVTILGTCPAEYAFCGKMVEFHFGGPRDGFHFAFDAEALRKLVKLGGEALEQLDAQPSGQSGL